MRHTAERTAAGKEAGAAAGEVLRRITEAAGVTLDHVEEISSAVATQAGAARALADSMSGIQELGERFRARSEEQSRACSVVEETHASVESMSHDALATSREQGEAVRGIHASVDAVRGELERVRASLEAQSASCREVASLLSEVYARTHAGSAASETLRDAAADLAARTDALRESVRAFTAGSVEPLAEAAPATPRADAGA
jgi:methyl-accepting chemotaxis protein